MPERFIPAPVHTNVQKYSGYASFIAAIQENLPNGCEVVEFSDVSARDYKFLSSDRHRPLKSVKLCTIF